MEVLVIDACVGEKSRTRSLEKYIEEKVGGNISRIRLMEEKELYALNEELLGKRNICVQNNDFSDEMFGYAKQFMKAETIIVAAPYWDLSFPAVLKKYIEAINVCGLTFRYDEKGMPVSLCKAKKLIYVTTAGGYIISDEFGYGYVNSVMKLFYAVEESIYIKAEGLDIYGADIEGIINKAKTEADKKIK
ncbi:MAG: NAD(P)H-dependent oxidoreductase [Firmicutes bacterium]|nr:NAD(P)H-dependent oxidoreductase [Bacillota bacterium]